MKVKRILIANRGEIAVRIIKTCRKLNIMAGVVFSEDDAQSLHVRFADEVFALGKGALNDTYLNIGKLIGIAKSNRYDAIHPGYGFLAENAEFARTCERNDIIFIGPKASVIELMGDKIASKNLAEKAGVSILKPVTGDTDALFRQADKYNFPILVKAVAGGGGKGMRIVNEAGKLKDALISTSREAKTYFDDERIFIERYVRNPRHIEVQIMADNHGNSVALFERECTLQRRHQKVIEEAPSPTLDPPKRQEILDAALRIVKTSGYTNAGTIEFLVEEDLNFYFLEMNTRIQVEHPVTELITGVDLVEEQIRIATGEKLKLVQEELQIYGHAIECRIYAEDPENNFYPSPGKIHFYKEPVNPHIRIDAAIDGAAEISGNYDPMIAKLIAWGQNRDEAISAMEKALDNYHIHGIHTNLFFQKSLIKDQAFVENKISTGFIEQHLERLLNNSGKVKIETVNPLLAAFSLFYNRINIKPANVWEEIGFWRMYPQLSFLINDEKAVFRINKFSDKVLNLSSSGNNEDIEFVLTKYDNHILVLQTIDMTTHRGIVSRDQLGRHFIDYNGKIYKVDREDNLLTKSINGENLYVVDKHDGVLISPMPGKILEISVKEGEKVARDQKLLVLEAMKMENLISAPFDGHVEKLHVSENDKVEAGNQLIKLQPQSIIDSES